ncbi:MAG TPA: serine/threonine-protein kinase [Propionibacteriaceae bacterium]|nr:serine/threonine-protein kinase [Propionibacteriaceae bacterium]
MHRLHDGYVLARRYRVSSRIASGGMGEVWSGTDLETEETLAIKIMHPHTAEEQTFAARFREEARLAGELRHPNIVHVCDSGEDDGLAFMVMELVPGTTVAKLVASTGAQRPALVWSVMSQVAAALAVAHEHGIVHRDVKPSNILITADGVVKLSDFGIAHATDAVVETRMGEILGTPHYLSPEQAEGKRATPQSDLYALGVVAHEMLTGHKPFARDTPIATALAHLMSPPPELPERVPEELAAMVLACLEKEPQDRPISAADLRDAVREAVARAGLDPQPRPFIPHESILTGV